jgi:hypothetical protein
LNLAFRAVDGCASIARDGAIGLAGLQRLFKGLFAGHLLLRTFAGCVGPTGAAPAG